MDLKDFRFVLITLGALALVTVAQTALAQGAPSEVRGKSLHISWTDNRTSRVIETGRVSSGSQSNSVRVYVSDVGRVFSEFDRTIASRGSDRQSDVSNQGRAFLHWKISGRTLVADQSMGSGARRFVITLDQNFSTCELSVIHGKAGSKPTRFTRFDDGAKLELLSINVLSTSCSVRGGNIFR